ncbi:MAG: GAF domain-containing protein, partial [Deltaproteobacteria bacterium]|nr:GAF domain-containing protein [Deltaproteobacteria bacterium]
MYSTQLVDINMDFQTRRQRLKHRLLRVVIPVGCVLLIVAAIMTITLVSYSNNRRDTLALSEDMLATLDRRIHSEINAYLMPASNLVRIGAEALREQIGEIWSPSRTPLGLQVIKTYPQLASFFAADPQGNFVMHKQNPDGTIDTKVIERESSNVTVTWIRRDAQDHVVNTETSGDDNYDPRKRLWYARAVQTRNLYWTDIYIFFTDKKPGLTVSYPLFSPDDQLLAVVGIDIKLEQISAFLANLKIGKNGRAMIVEDDGTLVAYPQLDRTFKHSGEKLETVMLDELDDPVLIRAYNRFKIDRHGKRVLVVDGRRYLNTVTSLKSAVGRDWSVMIIVAEEDFVGFLRANLRKVLLMTSVIVIITGILAVLLVYQGLRADRNARLLLERKQEIEAQSRAFSELASKTALWDPDDIESLEGLTETVSAAMAVRRASVWGYYGDERILKCEDSFDRETTGHTRGTVLKLVDYPQFWQDLIKGEDIIIADSAADPRTSKLHRVYLGPLGCTSLLAIPVMSGGKLAGAIWFEHEETIRRWNAETISFARAIAGMLALRLAATGRQDEAAEQNESGDMTADLNDRQSATKSTSTPSPLDTTGSGDSVMPKPTGESEKGNGQKISFSERLLQRGLTQNSIKADVYDNVTVLVLRFTDPFALAEYFGGDKATAAVDHLICHFEDLVDAGRIDYWKILSDQIVCATGMEGNSNRH